MRRSSVRLRTGIAISALALALSPVLALQAGASGGGWTPVGQGTVPANLPGVVAFGPAPASTPEQVSFILDEQNKNQLEQGVDNGSVSNLSVSQFANQYGQSQSNIKALTTYLAKFGITSSVYADDVDVSTTGTAGDYDAALSVTQDQYHVPAYPGHNGSFGEPAQTVHGPTTPPNFRPTGVIRARGTRPHQLRDLSEPVDSLRRRRRVAAAKEHQRVPCTNRTA